MGGYKTAGGGGGSEFLPLQKGGGGGKSFSHAKGGWRSFEVVLTWELEVLAIVMGILPCLEGRGAKSFGPTIFPFCSPPSP